MQFVYDPTFVGVAWKTNGFSGNMGGVGTSMPLGCLAFASQGAQERLFTLFLYDDRGQVTTRAYPFDTIPIQDGGPDHIARIDVTGDPTVVLHDGVVKVFYVNFVGKALWRFNTGYRLVP